MRQGIDYTGRTKASVPLCRTIYDFDGLANKSTKLGRSTSYDEENTSVAASVLGHRFPIAHLRARRCVGDDTLCTYKAIRRARSPVHQD